MLSIPLPFVASLMLLFGAAIIFNRSHHQSNRAFWFLVLCAAATAVVGLRWTTDISFFRTIQPMLGACLPVVAWWCFSHAHSNKPLSNVHWIGPGLVALSSASYPYLWLGLTDVLLVILYLVYGVWLLSLSFSTADKVRLSDTNQTSYSERVAGALLLFSAFIDGAISYDFVAFGAEHTGFILTFSYLILIPVMGMLVVIVDGSVPSQEQVPEGEVFEANDAELALNDLNSEVDHEPGPITDENDEAQSVVAKLDEMMEQRELFKDPDLTLNKLARKLGIPGRKISSSVNQVCGENISRAINRYRIEHAKSLLKNSDLAITEIYLAAGFQTKSNFNREFLRITEKTPSEFRSGTV
ncbi:helix-turn-helix domain-containing protein [Grimontia marina]|uniref:HTH-type transcriptional activator Btr n=1 Tax=Grimontia marina TaxID=646534 RepID=A0A128FIJ5_9GAMM|nr:helix-turn-helix domain-containing protein [Grimontia marina]CZF86096.1 HTH-type transcriptional activator Btr [Grimontia marina]